MKPFFSIIIPTLNEEKFVGKLLTDIAMQKGEESYEVIVVDAQSDDKTVQEVKKYKSRLPLLRIITSPKRNVSKQRNSGAHHARGSYLVFLDADSRIKSNFLPRLHRYLTIQKGLLFLPKLGSVKNDPQMSLAVDFSNAFVAISGRLGKPFSTGGSMVVEKHLFYLLGGFNENAYLSEDHLFIQTAHQYGVSAKLLPNVEVQFSMRRFYHEGKMSVLLKYIKSALYLIANGKIEKKIYEYEMGGHLYNKKSKKVFFDLMKVSPQRLVKEFNKNIKVFIKKLDL